MEKFYKHVRTRFRFAWGRSWKIRSWFIPPSFKKEADFFLEKNGRNVFFILGTGRSGTQLLTYILKKAKQVQIFHEPNFIEDVSTMEILRRDKVKAQEYWSTFRKYEVYSRWREFPNAKMYGEVNGTIRYQVPGILKEFPYAQLFLLARDGRGFIRSVMGWPQFYGSGSKGAYALKPLSTDPYLRNWKEFSRFEKICWLWRETNDFLLNYIPLQNVLLLEHLVGQYDCTKVKLLDKLGVRLSENEWRDIVSKPSRNASVKYGFPRWIDWTGLQKETFKSICGPTMQKLGYSID